ncbi:MAG TPA: hypothetical protein D7I05_00730 [Candidatus Poseidoniales archaeon]|nr:MAG TPA: hypothetical protein D7I05_00730 [Candidatus Poseidoniales archaeon]
MRSAAANAVYLLHIIVFVYGSAGWMLPMPGPAFHLVFLLGVRYHWHVTGGCILTKWEKHFLDMPTEEERHFTRNLLRSMGLRHIDDEGAYKVLTAGLGALAAMDTVFIFSALLEALN